MNELKERLEIEKQGWIENYMKKQVCTSKSCIDEALKSFSLCFTSVLFEM